MSRPDPVSSDVFIYLTELVFSWFLNYHSPFTLAAIIEQNER